MINGQIRQSVHTVTLRCASCQACALLGESRCIRDGGKGKGTRRRLAAGAYKCPNCRIKGVTVMPRPVGFFCLFFCFKYNFFLLFLLCYPGNRGWGGSKLFLESRKKQKRKKTMSCPGSWKETAACGGETATCAKWVSLPEA